MAYGKLKHNKLVKLIAQSPRNESAWGEFYKRYHKYICCMISRELNRLHHYKGHNLVEDLVQEVYTKLLANDCQALKAFEGKYENAIFTYLEIIAVRIVLKDYARCKTQKRSNICKAVSLDARVRNIHDGWLSELKELVQFEEWKSDFDYAELQEEIEYHLKKILGQRRNQERDQLIFRYYLYAGWSAEEIALIHGVQLSPKRVLNIISELKQELSTCLKASLVAY